MFHRPGKIHSRVVQSRLRASLPQRRQVGCSIMDQPLLFNGDEASTRSSLLSEVQTMQYILDHSEIPVPQVYDYELDPENPVNFRFIIMEAVIGRPLSVKFPQILRQYISSFLTQLAEYIVQLGTLSFSSIGRIQYNRHT